MKKLLLIVNAHSGRADLKLHILEVIDQFVRQGFLVTCITTQYAGHATEIVRAFGAEFDRVVCCGGDGTVNETLGGLMSLDPGPELGIIPSGTTNDYAYSLAIPSLAVRAAEVAAGDRVFPIDIGSLNGRFFTYVAAFGLFTEVTYQTNQDAKNILGSVAYVLEGARRISSVKTYPIRLTHEGGVIEDNFLVGLFSNSISIAGIRTAYRDALLDDGRMEICLIRPPKKLAEVQDVLNILLDIKQASQVDSPFLTIVHTKKALVESELPLAWTVDGEDGGAFASAVIKTHRRALRVIVGRDMTANSVAGENER